jgi:PKHD-type hydroxylase
MLITIDNVLSKDEVRQFRAHLDQADWQDGAASAGTLARQAKSNQQLGEESALAASLGGHLLRNLGAEPLFISAALPRTIYPPRFNRYAGGGAYGTHVDSAVMHLPATGLPMRVDLAATVFLAEPDEYEGGELEIEGQFGAQAVKLAAGDMVLYPASSLHRVAPVTAGARVASVLLDRKPGRRRRRAHAAVRPRPVDPAAHARAGAAPAAAAQTDRHLP